MPRNGIAGSYANSIFIFLKISHTVCHRVRTNLHSHNSVGGLPFLHTWNLLFVDIFFLMTAILTGMSWYLILLLILISLIINDVEHLFTSLLAICMSLEKCLFRTSAHFSTELFVLLLLGSMSCLWKLITC